MAFILAQMLPPLFPTPIGVFRQVERVSYERQPGLTIEFIPMKKAL